MSEPEVVGEITLYAKGCYRRIRRWLKGKHPKLGTLTWGYTGWETVQDIDVIQAMGVFNVCSYETSIPPELKEDKKGLATQPIVP